jgi:HPt (histidine-containing phosphotransfer) domain-containing protein
MEDGSSEPAFVEATFLELCELIPAERLERYIDAFEADMAALAAAAPDGDAQHASVLQNIAHKIVSQASILGLIRVSRRAARVEVAYEEKNGVATALREFREAAAEAQERPWPPIPRCD